LQRHFKEIRYPIGYLFLSNKDKKKDDSIRGISSDITYLN